MKKVLVPVDGSPFSEKVFDYALERARNLDYKLTFFRVVRAHEYGGEVMKEGIEDEIDNAEKFVEDLTEKANQQGAKADCEVIAGVNISNTIVSFAKENDYDLIIVGAKGSSDLGTIHLGSVAEGVVKRAHCSVLVVQ